MKIKNKREEVGAWLLQYLKSHDGTAFTSEIMDAAKASGFTKGTILSAKERLNIAVKRQGFGKGARWFWALADEISESQLSDKLVKDLTQWYKDNPQLI